MPGIVHFEQPTALGYFAALVADDASLPLLEAAVAVAQDEWPDLDVQGVLGQVDVLAHRLCQRLPGDAAPLQRLRLLNRYFFEELGFAGNVNDYHDPRNSLMPAVLETRRGIPITLALLYLELAHQAGLVARGISFPGHFMVKLRLPAGEVVIDPFSGRSLTRDELEERLQPFRHAGGEPVAGELPLSLVLQPASPREILARLLRNLKDIYLRHSHDLPRLVAVLRRMVLLLPQAWGERRDLALALAEQGQHAAAAVELEAYLQHQPAATDAPMLRAELAHWRRAH